MIEAEIPLPITCPRCSQRATAEFRMSIVTEALLTGDIRLYSNCHLGGWDASDLELEQIRRHLESAWGVVAEEPCEEFELEDSAEQSNLVFVHTGIHDNIV